MDRGLHGSRGLITEGSHGIGLAVASALAAEVAAAGATARDISSQARACNRWADGDPRGGGLACEST